MTSGMWECVKCGHQTEALIYMPPMKCPSCGAEYEHVEEIVGAHIAHTVPITRLKESDVLNVVQPIVVFEGPDSKAFARYIELSEKAHELAENARKSR